MSCFEKQLLCSCGPFQVDVWPLSWHMKCQGCTAFDLAFVLMLGCFV